MPTNYSELNLRSFFPSLGKVIKRVDLSFVGGTSDKVYIIILAEGSVGYQTIGFYGRRGSPTLQTALKADRASMSMATSAFHKLQMEKEGKGYQLVSSTAQPSSPDPSGIIPGGARLIWPQLAASRPKPDRLDTLMNDDNYINELKYDGVRGTTHVQDEGNGSRLFGRSGTKEEPNFPHEFTDKLPHISNIKFPPELAGTILDTEILSTKFSTSSEISGCINAEDGRDNSHLYVVMFDIIQYGTKDLVNLPWKERRRYLSAVHNYLQQKLTPAEAELFEISVYTHQNKWYFYHQAVANGQEGTILKNINAKYHEGGRPAGVWHKVKKGKKDSDGQEYDVFISGFTEGKGKYQGQIGAVKFAVCNPEVCATCVNHSPWLCQDKVFLEFANGIGKCQQGYIVQMGQCSGMTDAQRKDFTDNKDSYIGDPMTIEAHGLTKDLKFTWPRFVRMRPDKHPRDCTLQEVKAV